MLQKLTDICSAPFVKRSVGVLLLRLVGTALAYLMTVILSRTLPLTEFGCYSWFMSVWFVLCYVATFGQVETIIRLVPEYIATNEFPLVFGLRRWAYMLAFLGGAIASLSLAIIAPRLLNLDLDISTYLLASIPVAILAIAEIQGAFLRVFDQVVFATSREVTWRALAILVFGAIYFLMSSLEVSVVFTIICILMAIPVAVQEIRLTRVLLSVHSSRSMSFRIRGWNARSLPFWVTSTVTAIFRNIDVVVVGAIFSAADAGIYFVCARIAAITYLFSNAGNVVGASEISAAFHSGRQDEVNRLVTQSSILIFLSTAGAAISLIAIGPVLLSVFGREFTGVYALLTVLLASQIVGAFFGTAGTLLTVVDLERHFMAISAAALGVYALTITITGASLGLYGPALAQLSATAVVGVASSILARRRLGIDPTILGALSRVARKGRYSRKR